MRGRRRTAGEQALQEWTGESLRVAAVASVLARHWSRDAVVCVCGCLFTPLHQAQVLQQSGVLTDS